MYSYIEFFEILCMTLKINIRIFLLFLNNCSIVTRIQKKMENRGKFYKYIHFTVIDRWRGNPRHNEVRTLRSRQAVITSFARKLYTKYILEQFGVCVCKNSYLHIECSSSILQISLLPYLFIIPMCCRGKKKNRSNIDEHKSRTTFLVQ